MVSSVLRGNGYDETEIVRSLQIPLAIIAGDEDKALGKDYAKKLLWKGEIQWISGAQHSLILNEHEELCVRLRKFLSEINPN
jgi:pimeloyl-ACP methyl ester carboxylesterase